MKNAKRFLAIVLAVVTVIGLTGCGKKEEAELRLGVLKGPTGVGAISLMDKAEKGEYEKYSVTLTTDGSDIVAKLVNGDLDIGALPTNTAAALYKKTNGDVRIIALNTLGVLYILENGNTIKSVADLKGKTIYTTGRGANPEYVLNYILRQNGLEPGKDVIIEFKDATEVVTLMVTGEADVCMLPVPAATTVMMKKDTVRSALDVAKEYEAVSADGSVLTMGCLVATKKYVDEHPAEIRLFLERYENSIKEVQTANDDICELVAEYGITANAAIAKRAIPDAGIVCITGKDIRPSIEGYYKVLFDADPASVGGAIPNDDFYYTK